MASLIIELLSEEMPAGLQNWARVEFESLLIKRLQQNGLAPGSSRSYCSPRRLCVIVNHLLPTSPPTVNERRGPKLGAPQKAIEGFLRSCGKKFDELEIRETKSGSYYFSVDTQTGSKTSDLLCKLVPDAIKIMKWPKSMRWGSHEFRWIRPLRSILCVYEENSVEKTIEFNLVSIRSSGKTFGHAQMAPKDFPIRSIKSYCDDLRTHFVLIDQDARKARILKDAKSLTENLGLFLVQDDDLTDEITGLVEWPIALLGKIDPKFHSLPTSLLQIAMKTHQRYLSVLDPVCNKITHFIAIADNDAQDNGKTILAGNKRVLAARLEDAKFFLENDLRSLQMSKFAPLLSKLENVSYHYALGSQLQRVERITNISCKLARIVDGNIPDVKYAAQICKADLMSEIVSEFPGLQGLMGRYFAEKIGLSNDVSLAIEEHYLPASPNDPVPSSSTSIILGLADRINHLTGLFGAGEKPTGSRDPHALRRAASGIVRLIVNNKINIDLARIIEHTTFEYEKQGRYLPTENSKVTKGLVPIILAFIAERFVVIEQEHGNSEDIIDVCLAKNMGVNLLDVHDRVSALEAFLPSSQGKHLLHVFTRTYRILRPYSNNQGFLLNNLNEALLSEPAEIKLHKKIKQIEPNFIKKIEEGFFTEAMDTIADLHEDVDWFFDTVIVNDSDELIRKNRIILLMNIVKYCSEMGDLSKLRR